MTAPTTDPTAGEGAWQVVWQTLADHQWGNWECSCGGVRKGSWEYEDNHLSDVLAALLAARESAAATRARAEVLREAADRVREFRDWYPLSIFPSLDEALSDDYAPSSEQIAASSYRHAYGEVVPRNLRTWADEIEADALAPDTAGESA